MKVHSAHQGEGGHPALEYHQGFRFDESDIQYLATLTRNDGELVFKPDFLSYLQIWN